jgi:hypothetical protein
MNLFGKKMDPITLVAVVIMAISITLLDFEDLSFRHNAKSYLGIGAFILLLVVKRFAKPDKNEA